MRVGSLYRQPCTAHFDFKTGLLKRWLQIFATFVLLHSGLGEVIETVTHCRDLFGVAIHDFERNLLGTTRRFRRRLCKD